MSLASIVTSATEIAMMRPKEKQFVILEEHSVMTILKRLPALVAGIGPKMSTDRSVHNDVAGNNVSGEVYRRSDNRF